jgi:four helix bundle protein
MMAHDHRGLRVWQRAVDLIETVYLVSRELPPDERYGLTGQMRRAAVSIAANVAEGNGRAHVGEYLHHLSFAHGSLRELETLVTIAVRLRFLRDASARAVVRLTDAVGALLRALARALRSRQAQRGMSVSRFPPPAFHAVP